MPYKNNEDEIKWRDTHKEHRAAYNKGWKTLNVCKVKEGARLRKVALQKRIFEAYGNKCVCCGETEWSFFEIDHIYGGGNKHRKAMAGGIGGLIFYRWLAKNNFPEGVQILCANCHRSKHKLGRCIHEREIRTEAAGPPQSEISGELPEEAAGTEQSEVEAGVGLGNTELDSNAFDLDSQSRQLFIK